MGSLLADDVLYSLQLIGRQDSINVNKHIVRDWIQSMEVVNPHVFRVKLKEPHPEREDGF